MKHISISVLVIALVMLGGLRLSAPAGAATEVFAIRNARLVPVSGPTIDNGVIVMEGGKITALGANVRIPGHAKVLDARGDYVYPGMIDADTTIGLTEVGQGAPGTVDLRELGDWNSNIKAYVGINPHSELIPVTRANGITTVLSAPQGGIIAGQSVLFNLNGWTIEEMVVQPTVAMHINLPGAGRMGRGFAFRQGGETGNTREKQLEQFRQLLADARAYAAAKEAKAKNPSLPPLETDLILENLIAVVKGEQPVILRAERENDIKEAIKFAEEMKLKPIILGAAEGWRVAALLKEKNIPVIIGGVHNLPSRTDDGYDAAYANAAGLHKAGVKFCIATGDASNVRNLPYHAGMAAAYGLPKEEALKAVTLYPAQILGLGERLGSLEPGKVANVIVTTGDPLEIRTQVKHVYIAGKPVDLNNKHQELYERFLNRP